MYISNIYIHCVCIYIHTHIHKHSYRHYWNCHWALKQSRAPPKQLLAKGDHLPIDKQEFFF